MNIPLEIRPYIIEDELTPINAWIKYKGITQKELAMRLGVSQSSVSQVASCRHNRKSTLIKFSAALGVRLEHLYF